jgi:hypothetical protein
MTKALAAPLIEATRSEYESKLKAQNDEHARHAGELADRERSAAELANKLSQKEVDFQRTYEAAQSELMFQRRQLDAEVARQMPHRCSSLGPSPRLRHGSPDVGSSFGIAGIAGEVVVFNGTFNPVLGHAIGKSGDTESDVGGGGTVLVPS